MILLKLFIIEILYFDALHGNTVEQVATTDTNSYCINSFNKYINFVRIKFFKLFLRTQLHGRW